jgi:dihydrofolate reductase
MHVTLIAALAHDRVIGTGNGGIPWQLPRDAEHFRSFTAGKHMLLGRRTFEEMDGWFNRGQTPIILTSRDDYKSEIGFTAHSVDEALTEAAENGAEEVVVSGGASVYQSALPFTDELILTLVDADIAGEVRFPDYEAEIEWVLFHAQRHEPDDDNEFPMTFMTYRRVRPSSLRPARLHMG